MTNEEFGKIVKVLKAFYPSDKFLADSYAISAWFSQLQDIDYGMCGNAVKAYVQTNKFPPTVADIREKVNMLSAPQELEPLEAWAKVSAALRDGIYHAKERFDELPPTIQKAVGSPENLHNWATSDYETIETVIASNFQNAYRTVIKRKASEAQLTPELQLQVKNQYQIGVNNELQTT